VCAEVLQPPLPTRPRPPAREPDSRRRLAPARAWRWWLLGLAATLAVSVAFVVLTGMRPAFDAYGWLVWGRQATHLSLDTNAAPSWKPLTFLFTLPYALVLGRAALWLWMVTAVAAALAAPVFAARIAYQLSGQIAEHRFAAVAAGVFAAAGVLGLEGYWHFILIATADPMMVALSLAAIDSALSGRPRLAWLLLLLVCLGRPEALPVVVGYAVWGWLKLPVMRGPILVGLIAIPVLWFGIPALTSNSWLIAGTVLGESTVALPGSKFDAVMQGFLSLYELPMHIAVLVAVALAGVLRLRSWLVIAATAIAWMSAEVALAWHGWGVVPRYMFEPAAVLVVLVAAAAGGLLDFRPRRLVLVRWLAIAAVAGLVVSLAPHARIRARLVHNGIVLGRVWARQIHRLDTVIAKEGGAKRILACGPAVTEIPYQSILAWELDQNVIDVGWNPPAWTGLGAPVVYFVPIAAGWEIRPMHTFFSRDPAACERLRTTTPVN
jgi:hypothetical protein